MDTAATGAVSGLVPNCLRSITKKQAGAMMQDSLPDTVTHGQDLFDLEDP